MPPNLQLLRRRLLLLSGFGVLKKDKGPELGRFSNKSCVIPGFPSTSCYLLVISWWVCHCAVEICWNHSAPVSMNSARRRWMPATRWALSWRTMRHMRHMGVGMCGQAATKSVQSWSNLHQSCSKLIQHHKSALRYCIFLIYIYCWSMLRSLRVLQGYRGCISLHLCLRRVSWVSFAFPTRQTMASHDAFLGNFPWCCLKLSWFGFLTRCGCKWREWIESINFESLENPFVRWDGKSPGTLGCLELGTEIFVLSCLEVLL